MTAMQGVFLFAAGLILWAAFMMVTRQNLVHAAFYLILALFGVAIVFVLLDAGFLAVVQVLVYIGAISIIMIFAVMLTRGDVIEEAPVNKGYGWALLLSALFAFGLIILIGQWPAVASLPGEINTARDLAAELGVSLVSPEGFVIPFEVASVLLLAALIGALVVARPQKKGK
ncbi:MAG: NADH-quinone oxidoreductase subunit J [Anaerolineales bacterium]|nr:NADH-quinone oxidoreductase subunit J [Anaerolineales bacterium]MBX3005244.1 NADH-quinone oxidoreductase subunit J [Anaerolineales bacterium]MCW5839392.1 NADH-quinone oxidoreductase subunit J [Anaerolineales bacterium]